MAEFILQRSDRQIFGDKVEYNTDTEYGLVSGNARLIAEGTTLTGNQVEGWLKRNSCSSTRGCDIL